MLITLLVFLIILSILVLVHELGHFTAAKKFGIYVEEFGFGLPPRIFGKKIGETIYSLNWLPIGGFVKLYGEDREPADAPLSGAMAGKGRKNEKMEARAFYARPVWQRVIVLTAGVCMNFILAVIIISYLFTQGVMVPTNRVHIEKILAGSPAEQAGLEEGDIIKKFKVQSSKFKVAPQDSKSEEKEIKSGDDLINITREHLGEEMILVIERNGLEREVAITPRKDYPKDEGPMGVVISTFEEKRYPWWQAPFIGTVESLKVTRELVKGIGATLWKLVTFHPVGKDIAGPLGIAQMTGQAIKFGENAVLELMGLLSLNLAIVNILPFPALDGGRLLFVGIEAITGKRVKSHWERYAHQIGMIILLALIFLVTLNDLLRIFAG